MKRSFEYKDEKSNKFWQIETNGSELKVTYGKIGTAGKESVKKLAGEAACLKEAEKLIKEKTAKGYKERLSGPQSKPEDKKTDISEKAASKRPANVPEDAKWDEKNKEYSQGEEKDGKAVGLWKFWDESGQMYCQSFFTDTRFTITHFHADGTLAMQTCFNKTDGAPKKDGEFIWQHGDTSDKLNLSGYIPEDAWRVVEEYQMGVIGARFVFDKDGRQITDKTRPGNIPTEALWNQEQELWVCLIKDERGQDKERYYYEENGSIVKKVVFSINEDGQLLSHLEIFHPDGTLYFQREFYSDKMVRHGIFICQRGASENSYPFPFEEDFKPVPDNVWKIVLKADMGCVISEEYFDKDGKKIDLKKDEPKRAQNVPAQAEWDRENKAWKYMVFDDNGKEKERHYYKEDGRYFKKVLISVTKYGDPFYHTELFHPDGTLYTQTEFRTEHMIKEGTFICQRSENETDLEFPFKGIFPPVSDNVWKIVKVWPYMGQETEEFFDKAGNKLDAAAVKEAGKSAGKQKAKEMNLSLPAGEKISQEDAEPWPKGVKISKVNAKAMQEYLLSGKFFDKTDYPLERTFNLNADALVIDGDVHATGNLLDMDTNYDYRGKYGIIVINGNLTVDGTLTIGCDEHACPFVVLGSITAKNIISAQTCVVTEGGINVSGMFICMWEGEIVANGKINTRYYYGPDHHIEAEGKRNPKLKEVGVEDFLPEFKFDDDGTDCLNLEEIEKAMDAGAKLLK